MTQPTAPPASGQIAGTLVELEPAQPKVPVGPSTLLGALAAVVGLLIAIYSAIQAHDWETAVGGLLALGSTVSVVRSRTSQWHKLIDAFRGDPVATLHELDDPEGDFSDLFAAVADASGRDLETPTLPDQGDSQAGERLNAAKGGDAA